MVTFTKPICLFVFVYTCGSDARAVYRMQPFGSSCMTDADGLQGYQPNSNSSSININTDNPCHPPAASSNSPEPTLTSLQDQVSQTSIDLHTPVAVQSALDIALPGHLVASLASTLLGPSAEPQSSSTIGNLSAPVLGTHTQDSRWLPSHRTRALISLLPTGTPQPLSRASVADLQSSVDLEDLLEHNTQLDSPEHSSALLRGPTTAMSARQPSETPENALDVFLSALPSDVASSLEAGFSVVTHQLLATSESETRPTSRPSPSDQTDRSDAPASRPNTRTGERPTTDHASRPTSHFTQRPISNSTSRSSIHHTRPTSNHTSRPPHPTSRPHPTHNSTTLSTTTTTSSTSTSTLPPPSTTTTTTTPSPTPTASLTNAAESAEPTITAARQQSNGTIAGIATGSIAGVVLITLAIFFLLRRRQRKRASTPSPEQAYPEVAWLYDPVRSPPRSLSPSPALGSTTPQLGMMQTPARRSSLLAPEVVVMEGEPLLPPPGRAATRENSPAPGGGRSASPAGR